jgi:uncharacterized membrane protein HdeD (DUF308 family)
MLLLRGLIAIGLGIMAFAKPGLTLSTLVLLYGFYCLIDGIVALAVGLSGGQMWQALLLGLVGIGAGLATLFYPGLTAMLLLYFMAVWAIVRGIFEILAAIEFRKVIEGELMLVLAGIASIAFGVLIIANPGAGALSIIWILGGYALLVGVLLVIASFRLKALA